MARVKPFNSEDDYDSDEEALTDLMAQPTCKQRCFNRCCRKKGSKTASAESCLFRKSVRVIDAKFGASVKGYFLLVRWILVLNFWTGTAWFLLLCLPKVLNFSVSSYAALPTMLLTGQDLEDTFFFYGGYNQTRTGYGGAVSTYASGADVGDGISWRVDLVYLLLSVITYVFAFGAVVSTLGQAYEPHYDPQVGARSCEWAPIVFNAFPHNVLNKEVQAIKKDSTVMHWKTQLQKAEEADELSDLQMIFVGGFLPCPNKALFVQWLRRFIGVTLSVAIIVVTIVVITALILWGDDLKQTLPEQAKPYEGFLVPVTISVINIIIPNVVQALVKFEKYTAEVTLRQTLVRIYILKMFNVITTLYVSLDHALTVLAAPAGTYPSEVVGQYACLENFVGKLLWRMVVTDLIVYVLLKVVVSRVLFFAQFCITMRRVDFAEQQEKLDAAGMADADVKKVARDAATYKAKAEFNVAAAVIDVMYKQCLIWFAVPFSPMVLYLGVVNLFVIFFVTKWDLVARGKPAKKGFAVANSELFYFKILLVTLGISFISCLWFITTPSRDCGPFADYSGSFVSTGKPRSAGFQYMIGYSGIPYLSDAVMWATNSAILLFCVFILAIQLFFTRKSKKQGYRLLAHSTDLLEEETAEKERIIMKHAIDSEEKAEDTTSIFRKKLTLHRGARFARGGFDDSSEW